MPVRHRVPSATGPIDGANSDGEHRAETGMTRRTPIDRDTTLRTRPDKYRSMMCGRRHCFSRRAMLRSATCNVLPSGRQIRLQGFPDGGKPASGEGLNPSF